jgi:hypothetical protein
MCFLLEILWEQKRKAQHRHRTRSQSTSDSHCLSPCDQILMASSQLLHILSGSFCMQFLFPHPNYMAIPFYPLRFHHPNHTV